MNITHPVIRTKDTARQFYLGSKLQPIGKSSQTTPY